MILEPPRSTNCETKNRMIPKESERGKEKSGKQARREIEKTKPKAGDRLKRCTRTEERRAMEEHLHYRHIRNRQRANNFFTKEGNSWELNVTNGEQPASITWYHIIYVRRIDTKTSGLNEHASRSTRQRVNSWRPAPAREENI